MRTRLTLGTLLLAAALAGGCSDSGSEGQAGSGGTPGHGGSGGTGGTGGSGGTVAPGGSGGSGGSVAPGGSGGSGGTGGMEPGGSGGMAGSGGVGGGEPTGDPTIDSFEPTSGIVSTPEFLSQVDIFGTNFGKDRSKLQVKFNNVPSTIDKLVSSKHIRTHVPGGASDGPISVIRDGIEATTGRKVFHVLHDSPTPVLVEIDPPVVTAGSPLLPVVIIGASFTNNSRVLIDGEELDTDYDTPEAMRANIPAVKMEVPASFDLWVENPAAGNQTENPRSQKLTFQVVPPMRVLRALATGIRGIRVEFDQDVSLEDAANHNFYTVQEPLSSLAITKSQRDATHPSWVLLTSSSDQKPNADYTVTVALTVRSAVGGALDDTKRVVKMWSFGSTPTADGVFGQKTGCTPGDMSAPFGISTYRDRLYVMETEGQQVQVVGLDGTFLGFYGESAGVAGYHTKATAAADGCSSGGGSTDPGGFADPRGGVAVGPNGELIAADPGNDRVFLFKSTGVYDKSLGDGWFSPVVLGMYEGKAAIADAYDDVRLFDFKGVEDTMTTLSSGSGTADGEFQLGALKSNELPSLVTAGGITYVNDADNHRIQRLEGGSATGWIGVGQTDGFATGGTCCSSGTGNGEFNHPKGVAADAAGQIYVVDDGKLPSLGRLQKFDSAGKFKTKIDLDYAPGGMALDQEGRLWIVDTTSTRLRRYKP